MDEKEENKEESIALLREVKCPLWRREDEDVTLVQVLTRGGQTHSDTRVIDCRRHFHQLPSCPPNPFLCCTRDPPPPPCSPTPRCLSLGCRLRLGCLEYILIQIPNTIHTKIALPFLNNSSVQLVHCIPEHDLNFNAVQSIYQPRGDALRLWL